jgi:hypothetical protein
MKTFDKKKINRAVSFPERLDMREFVAHPTGTIGSSRV